MRTDRFQKFWLSTMTAITVSDLYIIPTGAGCAVHYDAGSMESAQSSQHTSI